jgi:hypothetical protein
MWLNWRLGNKLMSAPIGQTPKSQAGDILYTVRIRIKDVDARLRWGMTVEVTFPDK